MITSVKMELWAEETAWCCDIEGPVWILSTTVHHHPHSLHSYKPASYALGAQCHHNTFLILSCNTLWRIHDFTATLLCIFSWVVFLPVSLTVRLKELSTHLHPGKCLMKFRKKLNNIKIFTFVFIWQVIKILQGNLLSFVWLQWILNPLCFCQTWPLAMWCIPFYQL